MADALVTAPPHCFEQTQRELVAHFTVREPDHAPAITIAALQLCQPALPLFRIGHERGVVLASRIALTFVAKLRRQARRAVAHHVLAFDGRARLRELSRRALERGR